MKILFLTKYTDLGPSSRMRTFQYMPFYQNAGINCVVKPFFNDAYLKGLYNGKINYRNVLRCYLVRLVVLLSVFKYDKIYIEKEIFPYMPSIFESLLTLFNKEYIVDYDDAIFHNYDQSSNFYIKTFLSNKINQVMKQAKVVIAGNEYLADRAAKAGAKDIVIIPTAVDVSRYKYDNTKCAEPPFIVGWIGTKSTYDKHFLSIKEWLIKAQMFLNIEIQIIGVKESAVFLGPNVKFLPWSEEDETKLLSMFDIGIMPLLDSSWERGKCAYKIVQYLASGKPVIASNVGMNAQLCINGETGFLADSEEQFLNALVVLMNDETLRCKMGRNGRKLIEEKYDVQITSKDLIKILLKD